MYTSYEYMTKASIFPTRTARSSNSKLRASNLFISRIFTYVSQRRYCADRSESRIQICTHCVRFFFPLEWTSSYTNGKKKTLNERRRQGWLSVIDSAVVAFEGISGDQNYLLIAPIHPTGWFFTCNIDSRCWWDRRPFSISLERVRDVEPRPNQ